jgi:hypothetical protein
MPAVWRGRKGRVAAAEYSIVELARAKAPLWPNSIDWRLQAAMGTPDLARRRGFPSPPILLAFTAESLLLTANSLNL